ncbi:PKD domain-containing protein [Algoriphagus sp. AGSA1]|uniref:PKD domain-containing protein n=1 Tax=Algoriphagus sp. AGSA1 TaxID=2907213 RepID=UPI001F430B47|nr:PKD domain-containing protein [Algoriphagus sp. AGSA1]MCE7057829.1 PKD domain-containing protein [Algoriphagus sp. AGSA1]
MLKTASHTVSFYSFCLILLLSASLNAQVNDPGTMEICEGEPVTVWASLNPADDSPDVTWYHDSNGTVEIFSGIDDGIEHQLNADGSMTIVGLTYESTASNYIQASTYNYYVGVSYQNLPASPLEHIKVRVFNVPTLKTTKPVAVCDPNGSVDLSDFINDFDPLVFDYEIMDPTGNPIPMDEIYTQTQKGVYSVRSSYKDFGCWSATNTIQVTIADTLLEPDFTYEVDLGQGSVQVNGDLQVFQPVEFKDASSWNVVSRHWSFGDGNESNLDYPTHTYSSKGSYPVVLTAIDDIGCAHSIEKIVEVSDDYMIILPNAFTPASTKNHYFKPEYKGIASISFLVFNTWGELIYETDSLESIGWDGTWNGENAPAGNYVFKGIFITASGDKIIRDGTFLLIR